MIDYNKIVDNSSRTNKTVMNLYKNLIYISNIEVIRKLIFLTFNNKKILNHLKQAFIKTSIFEYFD